MRQWYANLDAVTGDREQGRGLLFCSLSPSPVTFRAMILATTGEYASAAASRWRTAEGGIDGEDAIMTALFEGIDLVDPAGLGSRCGLCAVRADRPRRLAGSSAGWASHRFRTVAVGGPENLFGIEILTNTESPPAGVDAGLSTIVLRVADMAAALATLAERGIQATSQAVYGARRQEAHQSRHVA